MRVLEERAGRFTLQDANAVNAVVVAADVDDAVLEELVLQQRPMRDGIVPAVVGRRGQVLRGGRRRRSGVRIRRAACGGVVVRRVAARSGLYVLAGAVEVRGLQQRRLRDGGVLRGPLLLALTEWNVTVTAIRAELGRSSLR